MILRTIGDLKLEKLLNTVFIAKTNDEIAIS